MMRRIYNDGISRLKRFFFYTLRRYKLQAGSQFAVTATTPCLRLTARQSASFLYWLCISLPRKEIQNPSAKGSPLVGKER